MVRLGRENDENTKKFSLILLNLDTEDEEDDEKPMEVDSNFDIKKFRQNLKAGNFYDGEFFDSHTSIPIPLFQSVFSNPLISTLFQT
jgi:hypothetical protein